MARLGVGVERECAALNIHVIVMCEPETVASDALINCKNVIMLKNQTNNESQRLIQHQLKTAKKNTEIIVINQKWR